MFVWERGDAVLNQHIFRVVPDASQIQSRYLFYALKAVMDKLRAKTHGATMKHITKGPFEKTEIPVPLLAEQERIVKLLDDADELRKLRAQADCRTADLIPALFHEMFGDPFKNPYRLPQVKLGEICEIAPNYGTMIPARDQGEWLSLRVANIQSGALDFTDKKFVNLSKEVLERHTVKDGDLLLARAIGSKKHLGKSIVAYPANEKWAFDSHLMRVRLNRNLCKPEWLKAFLESSGGRQLFLNNTRQSAVQFNINSKEFGNIVAPLPKIDEQQDFLKRVIEIRAMEDKQAASRQRLNDLFKSLLYRAFNGELL